jgi:hypothetical protein
MNLERGDTRRNVHTSVYSRMLVGMQTTVRSHYMCLYCPSNEQHKAGVPRSNNVLKFQVLNMTQGL